jgi:hypothetical protein
MGLPLLPSSVLVKIPAFDNAGHEPSSLIGFAGRNLARAFSDSEAWPVHLLVLLVGLHPLLRYAKILHGPERFGLRQEVLLAAVVGGALAAHLLFGSFGGLLRYQSYALAAGAAGTLILWHRVIARGLSRPSMVAPIIASFGLLVFGFWPMAVIAATPRASRSTYEHQYQMHRFAVDFYKRPIAVNDLGWVSYRNPNYVLDLWGLGSEAARQARLVAPKPGWMDRLVSARQIGLVMIYPNWFDGDIPAHWRRLAVLRGAQGQGTAGGEDTAFFATSPEAVPDALAALHAFAAAIGPAATLTIFDSPSAS